MQIILYVCKRGSLRGASVGQSVSACQVFTWLIVCVFVYAYVYIRVFVFAEQPCFTLLPVELRKFLCFLSGCWLLSRCCSSCCGTLSSIGNFSSLFNCFPSQGRRVIVLRGFLSDGATFAMQRLY